MSFLNLGLSPELLRAIEAHKYTTPTPIQAQAIPLILAGRDVMAGAQTGTGKTAAFTLPMLQRLSQKVADTSGRPRRIRALVLTPTRELAVQVHESIENYGKYLSFSATAIYGGVKAVRQIGRLQRGVDIVVATPGRLLDLAQQKYVDLSQVEVFILDEADRMLDMGFIKDVKKIMAMLPKRRQNLLFSATHSAEIKTLCESLLHDPAHVEVARRNTTAVAIEQIVHPVDRERKRELLSYLVGSKNWKQVLVFTRTKHGADRLSKQLIQDGLRATAIHGNKSQAARLKALEAFKVGEIRVLVATDVAARGLDIEHLPHVINFELPNVPEDYVHRIGRTGRAGNEGQAISLVCIDEQIFLQDIERLIQLRIPKVVISGYEPNPAIKAEPVLLGRRTNSGRAQPQRGAGQPQRQSTQQPRRPGQKMSMYPSRSR